MTLALTAANKPGSTYKTKKGKTRMKESVYLEVTPSLSTEPKHCTRSSKPSAAARKGSLMLALGSTALRPWTVGTDYLDPDYR